VFQNFGVHSGVALLKVHAIAIPECLKKKCIICYCIKQKYFEIFTSLIQLCAPSFTVFHCSNMFLLCNCTSISRTSLLLSSAVFLNVFYMSAHQNICQYVTTDCYCLLLIVCLHAHASLVYGHIILQTSLCFLFT